MSKTIWNKLNKHSKSNYDISKKTNIPEEKVKEILDGKRELPSEKVNDFVKVLHEDDGLEKTLNIEKAKVFFEEIDLIEEMTKFGYQSQRELSDAAGVPACYVSHLKNRNIDKVHPDSLVKLYDFFQDTLNKKVCQSEKRKQTKKQNSSPHLTGSTPEVRKEETNINILDEAKVSQNKNLQGTKYVQLSLDLGGVYEPKESLEIISNDEVIKLEEENKALRLKVDELQVQLRRYEKLIDMIK